MDLNSMRALGSEPVPGSAPGGEPIRYEPEFERLSAEIEKLTSVEQTPVDWNEVVQLGSGLLRQGKDLLVASYLTYGLLERAGYAGLAAGCGVLRGLVDNFWDGLFPELRRLRARIAALEWLAERLEKALPGRGEASEADRGSLTAAIAELEAIRSAEAAKFDGDGPNLGPAVRALQDKLAAIPQPVAPEPEPSPAAAADTAATAAPAQAAPPPPPEPEPDDPDTVAAALAKTRERQVQFAGVLRRAKPDDPRGYHLLREALWSDLPHDPEHGVQSVVGAKGAIAGLAKGLEEGEYEDVLRQVEELLPEHPLWFDLQLLAVGALDGLGRKYARVRHAVVESLVFLLRRRPDLATGKDQKGKPLASKEAKVWLANEIIRLDEPERGDLLQDVARQARKLVARGKLGEAMRFLTGRIDATASRRGRFVLRLDLARLCIEAGRSELAVPQLEQLEQEVSHFSLEEWEPDLAAEVVRSLWQCCVGPEPAPSLADRGQDIYARLCRLDPAAAVSAKGPQGE